MGEKPMLVPAGAFQRLQQQFSPVTSFTSNDAPIDEQDLDYSVRSAIVMGVHDEAELGMDLDMPTFDDLMQLNVLDEDVAVIRDAPHALVLLWRDSTRIVRALAAGNHIVLEF